MVGQHPDPLAWRPVVLDVRSDGDRRVLDELRNDACIEVLDQRDAQRQELGRLRPEAGPDIVEEDERWVYFPWRRSVIGILGPIGFHRLRLDRNRNKISRSEQELLANQRVGVVGLSVGHAIAHTLALEGLCGELRLADFDTIELSNLNRIPATILDLGLNKAVVAARRITELDPYLDVTVLTEGLTAESMDGFMDGLTVVIEECDSLDVKLLVREAARRYRVPVIMETSDRGLLDVERFDLEPTRPAFHGLVGDLRADDLVGLSTHDKVPHVLRILEPGQLSARMAASMAEIDYTVTTWPQLGGDIALGAASVASAVRRIGLGEELRSGRVRIDLESTLDALSPPELLSPAPEPEVPPASPPIAADDAVTAILDAARLAPSGGNSQPWAFAVDHDGFSIDMVPSRSSGMDVQFRGSYAAIGAALYNVRVAAARYGVLGPVQLFPDPGNVDRVATLHFGTEQNDALSAEYPAMLERCTNRQFGRPSPIDEGSKEALRQAVTAEGAHLHLHCSPEVIRTGGELLGAADRIRYLTPTLHGEMMSELRWPEHDTLELGLDVRTLELDGSDLAKLAVARRGDVMEYLAAWNGGEALGEVTRDRLAASSALAVLTVQGSDPSSYVRGGSAVERFWITAHEQGLAVHPVSPVFLYAVEPEDYASLVAPQFTEELVTLATSFRSLVGVSTDEQLVLVLRVSHAPPPTARSGRLPASALLGSPWNGATVDLQRPSESPHPITV